MEENNPPTNGAPPAEPAAAETNGTPRPRPQTSNPLKTQLISHLVDERREAADSGVANKNPLDESEPFRQLCEACRRGDVKTVQSLIAFEGVNVNAVDRYDYPPLTLASLCGHYEVVQLLLESGALCERDTFQGERCLYSALNDRIRSLLLQYDYSKSMDPAQPWAAGVASLLACVPIDTTDVTLIASSGGTSLLKEFRLHKFLLSARSSYFRRKFQAARTDSPGGKPKVVKNVRLSNSVDARAFETAVKHLYLGEVLEVFSQDVLENIERLTRHLDLPDLWDMILVANDPKQRRQKRAEAAEKAQSDLEKWFEEYVLGRKIVADDASKVRIGQENDSFADVLLQADASEETTVRDVASPPSKGDANLAKKVVLYPVHKAMLRSEFFTTMFSSSFREGQKPSSDEEALPIIPIDASPDVLQLILSFFYSEKTEIPLEHALDTLFAADELLIDRLKAKCAQVISTAGNTDDLPYSIYDVIRAGWMCRVRRLEEFGALYIAERLEDYIGDEEFADLVKESASRIKERQETDTIELIDDIRYYLDNVRFRLRMEDMDMEDMYNEEAKKDDGTDGEAQAVPTDEHEPEELDEEDFMRQETLQYTGLLEQIEDLLGNLELDA